MLYVATYMNPKMILQIKKADMIPSIKNSTKFKLNWQKHRSLTLGQGVERRDTLALQGISCSDLYVWGCFWYIYVSLFTLCLLSVSPLKFMVCGQVWQIMAPKGKIWLLVCLFMVHKLRRIFIFIRRCKTKQKDIQQKVYEPWKV